MPTRLPAGTPRGIALGVIAYALFAMHDAVIKWLVGHGIPAWEVLCCRSAVIVTLCLAAGRRRLAERALATPIKGLLLVRGALTLGAWLSYYSASAALQLAQLLTLYFAAPIITTLLAVPLLRERVPPVRWVALACGFAGVAVACDPGGVAASWATMLALTAALLWGYTVILMRQTALAESNLLLMLYSNGFFLVVTAIACVAVRWQTPTAGEALALVAVGGIGTLAQLALFEGMRHAPASVMAPTEYTALIWAFVLGFAIWGDIPRLPVFLGAALILVSGAVLLASERQPRRAAGSP
jgi:drug/metabolite transporter (DMT)-like permease